MKNNRIIAVDIEHFDVKIAEIEITAKVIKPIKTAALELQTTDESSVLENIQRLVTEICEKIRDSEMTAKSIILCSPFLGGAASLQSAEKIQATVAELLQRKPFETGGIGGGKAKKSYGTLKKEEKTIEYFIENTADEFLLAELARLFSEQGFSLKSAEYTVTALLNLTALSPYTYDSKHKFIIDVSDRVTAIITECDIPIDIRRWNVDFTNLSAQITDYAVRDMNTQRLKNPLVILCGSKLNDSRFKAIKAELESADFVVADVGIQADFAACAGLALKSRAKTKTNLLPQKTRYILPPELKEKLAGVSKTAACLLLFSSVFLCGFSGTKLVRANLAFNEIPVLQSQIDSANAEISVLADNAAAVGSADSRINSFLSFCTRYGKTDVFIASADTENLLKQAEVESGLNAVIEFAEPDSRRLIVRGYAVKGKAALDFYDALQTAEFAPKMSGLQTERLPSGEEVTIFELEMIM